MPLPRLEDAAPVEGDALPRSVAAHPDRGPAVVDRPRLPVDLNLLDDAAVRYRHGAVDADADVDELLADDHPRPRAAGCGRDCVAHLVLLRRDDAAAVDAHVLGRQQA